MKTRIMPLLAIAALVVPAAALSAEPPKRGLTESQVRSQLGAPHSTRGPVGTPAITRWSYDGFTVYFENGISLHTVVDRPAPQAPQVVSGTAALPPIEEKAAQAAPEQTTPQPGSAPATEGEMAFDPTTGRFIPADAAAANTPEPSEAEPPVAEPPVEPAASEQPQPEAEQAPEETTTETAASPEPKPEPTPAPAPAPAPEAAPTPQPEPTPAPAAEPANDSEFRFDPVTGRIIIAGQETPEEAAARAETEATLAKAKEEAAKASAEEAVADSKAEAKTEVRNAKEEAESRVEETAEEATKAANEAAEDAEEDGGFYIDWGARQ